MRARVLDRLWPQQRNAWLDLEQHLLGAAQRGHGIRHVLADANFSGSDSFTYKVNDGTLDSNVATVSVTVNAFDDPPTAVNDSATVTEDSGANAINVLANDTDSDGGPKTIQSVTQPANGSVSVTGGGSGLTYTPNANYCNSGSPVDSFSYTLNGGSTATVSVTVTCVDDPPTAVNDSATVTEDSGANAINVLANDTDSDGGPKTIQSVTQPANGSVSVTGGGSGLTYTPNANYCNSGSPVDSFSYTLNGGSTATVSVTVTCVDDPPMIAFTSGATTVDEGQTETYVSSITDPDSSSFTYEPSYPMCGAGGTLVGTPSLGTSSGSFQCKFLDGPVSPTIAAQVATRRARRTRPRELWAWPTSSPRSASLGTRRWTRARLAPTRSPPLTRARRRSP